MAEKDKNDLTNVQWIDVEAPTGNNNLQKITVKNGNGGGGLIGKTPIPSGRYVLSVANKVQEDAETVTDKVTCEKGSKEKTTMGNKTKDLIKNLVIAGLVATTVATSIFHYYLGDKNAKQETAPNNPGVVETANEITGKTLINKVDNLTNEALKNLTLGTALAQGGRAEAIDEAQNSGNPASITQVGADSTHRQDIETRKKLESAYKKLNDNYQKGFISEQEYINQAFSLLSSIEKATAEVYTSASGAYKDASNGKLKVTIDSDFHRDKQRLNESNEVSAETSKIGEDANKKSAFYNNLSEITTSGGDLGKVNELIDKYSENPEEARKEASKYATTLQIKTLVDEAHKQNNNEPSM